MGILTPSEDGDRIDFTNIGYFSERLREDIAMLDPDYVDNYSEVYASFPISGERSIFNLFSHRFFPSRIVIITDQNIKIFDANTYESIASYQHSFSNIASVGFSPDQSLMAISEDHRIKVLDLLSGQIRYDIQTDYIAHSVDINAAKTKILLSEQGGLLSEIRLADNKELTRWRINTSSTIELEESGYNYNDHTAWITNSDNMSAAFPLNSPYFNERDSAWIGTPIATRDLLQAQEKNDSATNEAK